MDRSEIRNEVYEEIIAGIREYIEICEKLQDESIAKGNYNTFLVHCDRKASFEFVIDRIKEMQEKYDIKN